MRAVSRIWSRLQRYVFARSELSTPSRRITRRLSNDMKMTNRRSTRCVLTFLLATLLRHARDFGRMLISYICRLQSGYKVTKLCGIETLLIHDIDDDHKIYIPNIRIGSRGRVGGKGYECSSDTSPNYKRVNLPRSNVAFPRERNEWSRELLYIFMCLRGTLVCNGYWEDILKWIRKYAWL